MSKYFTLGCLFLFAWGCQDNIKTVDKKTSFKTVIVSDNPLPTEYFFKTYKKGKLDLYDKEHTSTLYKKLIANPNQVITLSKSDIFSLLGTPNLIKSESFLELWQYRSDICILNVAWNSNLSDFVYVTKTYSLQLKEIDFSTCLTAVVNYSKNRNLTP